jgi:hypothetical protein
MYSLSVFYGKREYAILYFWALQLMLSYSVSLEFFEMEGYVGNNLLRI